MQAAIASSSISPYIWIVSGPRSSVPVCGEGMNARLTRATFCPPALTPASATGGSDQDVEGGLVRTALLDQRDREMEVDVVPRGERDRVARVVAGAHELLGPPVLDALRFRLGLDVEFRRSHLQAIRWLGALGSPPPGGYQSIRRASCSARAFVSLPSRRRVSSPRVQIRTLPWILTVFSRYSPSRSTYIRV